MSTARIYRLVSNSPGRSGMFSTSTVTMFFKKVNVIQGTQRRTLDDTGRTLVRAAADLLVAEGPTALTVRRISTAAGVSTMSLYDRFGDKNGVVDEVFIQGFESLATSIHRAKNDIENPLEALAAGLRAYRSWALANRSHCTIMFAQAVAEYEPSMAAMLVAAEAFAILVAGVARAMDSGQLAARAPHDVAASLWAAVHGHVVLELDGASEKVGVTADHFELTIATLLRGFGS